MLVFLHVDSFLHVEGTELTRSPPPPGCSQFSLLLPEKHLNYRTQLLHSHMRGRGSESSTHLKVHYNDLLPLVAGLQWSSPPADAAHKKWEGTEKRTGLWFPLIG